MKEKSRQKRLRLLAEAKKKPAVFTVYIVLRLIVVAILVSSILRGEYENAAICLLVLFLFLLPLFVQRNFGIELPGTLEIIILVFIFASEILGELGCFFINVPNWDSILHTTTGFLCAAFGFALIDILNRNDKIKFQLSPIYVALVAFCFSMTIGVLWEFFEFSMDRLFHMDMQKDTIVHTISSVMLIRAETQEALDKKKELMEYIREEDRWIYHRLRWGIMGCASNLPGKGGRKTFIAAYKLCQKFYGFN